VFIHYEAPSSVEEKRDTKATAAGHQQRITKTSLHAQTSRSNRGIADYIHSRLAQLLFMAFELQLALVVRRAPLRSSAFHFHFGALHGAGKHIPRNPQPDSVAFSRRCEGVERNHSRLTDRGCKKPLLPLRYFGRNG
jgi:hypothetical protein